MDSAAFEPLSAATSAGPVVLAVRDLPHLKAWYGQVLGLAVQREEAGVAVLGPAEGVPLLLLQESAELPANDPKAAGLFHLAMLLPDRPALAQWLAHVAALGLKLQGASDHLVSEAIYLADPEGNGIEVYRDRLRAEWRWSDDRVKMATLRLDLQSLLAEATVAGPWSGAPAGTMMGHVHLQVADLDRSRLFYVNALGLRLMTEYPGALFVAAGGYHHHLGLNIWNSAGRRRGPQRGLQAAVVQLADSAEVTATARRLSDSGYRVVMSGTTAHAVDPSGIPIVLTPGPIDAIDLMALGRSLPVPVAG